MKKIVTFFMLMIFGMTLLAKPVSKEEAQNVAVSFHKHYVPGKADYTISDVVEYSYNGISTFYVFNFKAGGYVMVSADDAAIPILAHSDSGTFDKNAISPSETAWLEDYSKQIESIVSNNIDNTETLKEWKKIQNNQFNPTTKDVAILCTAAWDQGSPWNTVVAQNTASGVYAGCVATAMGIVMYKWKYPTTGNGTHTYTEATYGDLTVNFGSTTYAWSSMSNTSASTASETLLYHNGVSVNMTYSTSASGAYQFDIPYSLKTFYKYQPSIEIQNMSNFTSANWLTLLKSELDAGRPILYAGATGGTSSSGHSFVCDGYKSASNTFHINWGWSSVGTTYYAIGSLNSGNGNFNSDNQAVVRVCPLSNAPIANFTADNAFPAVGGSVNFTDLSTNNPSTWEWTFEGGTPSTFTGKTPGAITYTAAGEYMVTLKVTNATGNDTKFSSKMIKVGHAAPQWIMQNCGSTVDNRIVSEIDICSPDVAWGVVVDGGSTINIPREIIRTTNGGTTWKLDTITFTGVTDYNIANICAIDANTCYAAMFPLGANGGKVAKTTDGGATWSIANSPDYSTSWLNFVHFFDANNGCTMGDPNTSSKFVNYYTTNGGSSWTQVLVASAAGETGLTNNYDAVAGTDSIWYGSTKGKLFRSADKGHTWTYTNYGTTGNTTGFGATIQVYPSFKNGSVGVLTGHTTDGAYSAIKRSTNGGTSFSALTPTGYFVKNPNIEYIPGSDIFVDVASYPGTGSSYSIDNCSTFKNIDTGSVSYYSVKFYNYSTGWAGSIVSPSNGGIYKWNPNVFVSTNDIPKNNENITIFPNPVNDMLNIEFKEYLGSKTQINIYNLVGELVYSEQVNPTFNDIIQLDLSAMKAGIYMVNIDDGNKMISKKISLIK
ncbi:MAG TPA: C10 family peptidase [Bacteroidales bacterium]|nr:C10 family peptidase [Bacteroidales bacterium]HPS16835.1 C10 family peptidase [Bacteroidales bacterium]